MNAMTPVRLTAPALIVFVASFTSSSCRREEPPETRSEASRPVNTTPAPPRIEGQQSYADVVDQVIPAVVTVRSERRVRAPRQFPFFNDPFFREFFGLRSVPEPRERVQRGLGSGVVVRADGYIITNHHVIDGAQDIRVEFVGRRSHEARLIGSDPPSDIAVLKIEASDLPVLRLGNSDQARVGDVVLAVGNPLGVGQTVTAGIVSAKGRYTGISDGSFEDFIQTDAPINQGNSGGALVNTAAELIGINSQILTPTGGNIGIGFAIPSNMARDVMQQLIDHGEVRRGQLGVTVQELTAELAASFGVKDLNGVVVAEVAPRSPAARAGLRPGDIIRRVDDEEVTTPNVLRNAIARRPPGSTVTLAIIRDGKEQQLSARLGEFQPRTPNE